MTYYTDCGCAQKLELKMRIAELEARELGWITTLSTMELEAKQLRAEVKRLRDKALKIGKAIMTDPPFDTFHGIDIHETASDYAEWDGRVGEIMPIDYFEALVSCCKESPELIGGGE